MIVPSHAVYASAKQGPFDCSHCEYFTSPTKCSNIEIVKLRHGVVEAGACCDYFEKKSSSVNFTADDVRRASGKG